MLPPRALRLLSKHTASQLAVSRPSALKPGFPSSSFLEPMLHQRHCLTYVWKSLLDNGIGVIEASSGYQTLVGFCFWVFLKNLFLSRLYSLQCGAQTHDSETTQGPHLC